MNPNGDFLSLEDYLRFRFNVRTETAFPERNTMPPVEPVMLNSTQFGHLVMAFEQYRKRYEQLARIAPLFGRYYEVNRLMEEIVPAKEFEQAKKWINLQNVDSVLAKGRK